jgi:hypothetical protein
VETVVYFQSATSDGSFVVTGLILEDGAFLFLRPDKTYVDAGRYDPSDLWWRLRESGGVLYFDTSMDGKTFQNRGSIPDPAPLDSVTVGLGAGENVDAGDAGEAEFRCYNLPGSCP